jgi:Zn-dependent protease with chaperone function
VAEERLSEQNYPELYKDVQTLLGRMQRDFPHETFPPVAVADSQAIYAQYGGLDTTHEYVVVSKGLIDTLGGGRTPQSREEILAVIAHEYGHDIQNYTLKMNALRDTGAGEDAIQAYAKTIEKEADAIAVRYVDAKTLACALQNGLHGVSKNALQGMEPEQRQNVLERIRLLNAGKTPEAHACEASYFSPTPSAAPKMPKEGVER